MDNFVEGRLCFPLCLRYFCDCDLYQNWCGVVEEYKSFKKYIIIVRTFYLTLSKTHVSVSSQNNFNLVQSNLGVDNAYLLKWRVMLFISKKYKRNYINKISATKTTEPILIKRAQNTPWREINIVRKLIHTFFPRRDR